MKTGTTTNASSSERFRLIITALSLAMMKTLLMMITRGMERIQMKAVKMSKKSQRVESYLTECFQRF